MDASESARVQAMVKLVCITVFPATLGEYAAMMPPEEMLQL